MPGMHLNMDGEHEAFGKRIGFGLVPVIHTTEDWHIDVLEGGMQSGRSSLMIIIPAKLPTHQKVHLAIETSVQSWMQVAGILRTLSEEEAGAGWAVVSDDVREMLRPRYAEALRRVLSDITQEQALEAAEMFIDALAAGSPEDLHE
jgi:hypothetical protein